MVVVFVRSECFCILLKLRSYCVPCYDYYDDDNAKIPQ